MTQFYVPFAEVNEQTFNAAPPNTIFLDVSDDNDAYWRALSYMWEEGQDFAVIEHDVICRPDVVEQFDNCPEPWCMFAYDNMCHEACKEAWANALGCTRFRKEVIDAVPHALSAIPEKDRDWHNVCDGLGNHLREAGYTHHWHAPDVGHHPWFVSR